MSKTAGEYWLTWDGKDVASKLMEHHHRYYGTSFNPIWQMWQRNTYAYYSTVLDSQAWFTALQFVGEQGELVKMSVPQARSLIRQLLTLTTKQKLAFNAIAEVEDTSVTEEVRIADSLCEQTIKDKSVDVKNELMVEDGLVIGTGFMKATWRSDLGDPVAVDGGQVIYEGDLEITVPHMLDLTYNFQVASWDELDWVECRVRRNRWMLIAQHPDLAEEIKKVPSISTELRGRSYLGFDDDDLIYVYELFHKPTPALPHGRMIVYANTKTIFYDDVNPYGCIPIEQFKPEPIRNLGFGYPMLSNLLPAQEMYDHEFSAIATNHSALGVQNIAMPRGGDINVQELMGMNFMWYTPQNVPGGGKPETLDLVRSSPELYKFSDVLLRNMQQISNINAAVRGELSDGSSGKAIATLTTNSLEFLTSYSKAMNDVLEKIMMHSINAYRRFAKTPRLVRITGKNYQSFSKKFTGDQLAPIQSIRIQAINPLMQSMAGRVDIADKTADKGLITNVQEYVNILDGAPLSQLFESDLSQNDLIHAENEALIAGKPVPALSIDNHPLHILKHKALLNDLSVRSSPLAQVIQNHILEHSGLVRTTDPMLMAMANTGKMPQMPPEMAPPPGAPPPGDQGPQHGDGHPPQPPHPGGPNPMGGGKLSKTANDDNANQTPELKPATPSPDALGRR